MKVWRWLGRVLLSVSCDPRRVLGGVLAWPSFLMDIYRYRALYGAEKKEEFAFRVGDLSPQLRDKREAAGAMGVYFFQDLYVARRIYQRRPQRHVDIGSRVDGFVAHILVFMDVSVVDVRPLQGIPGLATVVDDARFLGSIADDSLESISCLHALEHFGLGRYGDEIDPDGWRKALARVKTVLAPGGTLYLSVPVGNERLEFNSQRVFAVPTIASELRPLRHVRTVLISATGEHREIHAEERLLEVTPAEAEGRVAIFEYQKNQG